MAATYSSYAEFKALPASEQIAIHFERNGCIADVGQVDAPMQRELNRLIRAGEVFKYRGFWNTKSPCFGMGPLKTIYAPIEAKPYIDEQIAAFAKRAA